MADAQVQPQASLYEETIENADLEAALEQRQKLKEKIRPLNKQKKEADAKVKALVDIADIADAPVRIGRFVISRKQTEARHVEFDADASERIQIKLLDLP